MAKLGGVASPCHASLAVASILARMHMDAQSLMAFLHDVIDTGVNKEDIGAQFGEEVAELVDGVSKLTHVEFDSVELRRREFSK